MRLGSDYMTKSCYSFLGSYGVAFASLMRGKPGAVGPWRSAKARGFRQGSTVTTTEYTRSYLTYTNAGRTVGWVLDALFARRRQIWFGKCSMPSGSPGTAVTRWASAISAEVLRRGAETDTEYNGMQVRKTEIVDCSYVPSQGRLDSAISCRSPSYSFSCLPCPMLGLVGLRDVHHARNQLLNYLVHFFATAFHHCSYYSFFWDAAKSNMMEAFAYLTLGIMAHSLF